MVSRKGRTVRANITRRLKISRKITLQVEGKITEKPRKIPETV